MSNLEILNLIEPNKFTGLDHNGEKVIFNNKYLYRLMYMPYKYKYYYQEVKNKILSYGAKDRITSKQEIFRLNGVVAKMKVRGTRLRLYLNLDESYLDKGYHLKKTTDKKMAIDTKCYLILSSKLMLKKALELLDIIFESKNKKIKKSYVQKNFIKELIPNGEVILNKLGFKNSYYVHNTIDVKGLPKDLPNNLENYIPKLELESNDEDIIANIWLDTLCMHFKDNDVVTLDILKEKQIISRGNYLKIKSRGNLTKKLIIVADEFEKDALAMLLCTNSQPVLIERK